MKGLRDIFNDAAHQSAADQDEHADPQRQGAERVPERRFVCDSAGAGDPALLQWRPGRRSGDGAVALARDPVSLRKHTEADWPAFRVNLTLPGATVCKCVVRLLRGCSSLVAATSGQKNQKAKKPVS